MSRCVWLSHYHFFSHGLILRTSSDAVALGRAKVTLDNGRMSGGVTADGSFTMYAFSRCRPSPTDHGPPYSPNVPIGPYLLSVISHDYSFDNVCFSIYTHERITEQMSQC